MSKRFWIGAAALYATVGVITFGHSAAFNDREYAACKARERPTDYCTYVSPMAALPAAIAWPLYWSWEAFS